MINTAAIYILPFIAFFRIYAYLTLSNFVSHSIRTKHFPTKQHDQRWFSLKSLL